MDFAERIAEPSKKVRTLGDGLNTEEATKNALVMPFITALGYDVFNPGEVVPEFSAPIGEYKDARVDIEKLDDILPLADRIRATAQKYDAARKAKEGNE